MEESFWHDRWSTNQIGFHAASVNAFLQRYFGSLDVPNGGRVFVPLCGKTRDIGWMLEQGFCVVGAELSELAVRQLFEDLGVTPAIRQESALKRFSAERLDVFVGDVFDLTVDQIGPVDGVYDRAALVALPQELRERYAVHVGQITGFAPQLLLTFDYDQAKMDGPPFSVPEEQVTALFGKNFEVTLLERHDIDGGFRGKVEAADVVWSLVGKHRES